ncbi:hypothetical protein Pmar_PMAR012431 [Perkinsus marinus ATCC 50983]|uniref:Uncharacterized protein n=1 Tax=Perkinsus marinus (strain ATCC 50983 / TXsc) TaxID=423536 RepID=C5K7B6_PERM5|nr:hypothetical protein Pmar_PMAR012431 [Perkinsus marinus ATCC 50983]EER19451.1 hypothetical protein Pmar_PMAR012431 [Perkinsus marinus ATCC 50983]|eukprot:XP_002787655.1 hypothetical protein Pmar_PMAR012431 [Perkinsus marinus ATCC 50983]
MTLSRPLYLLIIIATSSLLIATLQGCGSHDDSCEILLSNDRGIRFKRSDGAAPSEGTIGALRFFEYRCSASSEWKRFTGHDVPDYGQKCSALEEKKTILDITVTGLCSVPAIPSNLRMGIATPPRQRHDRMKLRAE